MGKKALIKAFEKAIKNLKKKPVQKAKAKEKKEEEPTDPTAYRANRFTALAAKEKAGGVGYPHKFHVTHTLAEFVKEHGNKHDPNTFDDKSGTISVAGRVMVINELGKKLVFYQVLGNHNECVQIMANQSMFESADDFKKITRELRRGFIIGVTGYPGRTKTKELTVYATAIITLTPCLRMLPDYRPGSMKSALQDTETRYRKRYLDILSKLDDSALANYPTTRTYLRTIGLFTPAARRTWGKKNLSERVSGWVSEWLSLGGC